MGFFLVPAQGSPLQLRMTSLHALQNKTLMLQDNPSGLLVAHTYNSGRLLRFYRSEPDAAGRPLQDDFASHLTE